MLPRPATSPKGASNTAVDAVADNAEHSEPQTPGQILAREREHQGLSRSDVAQRLHMSPWQVEAIESGDYGRLPKGPFLRGFVRNYAKVLGLEPESVLSLLSEARPRDPLPGIVVPTQNIRFDPIGERLSSPYVKASAYAVVAVAIGFAAMYWWMYIRPTPPAMSGKKPAAEVTPDNVASAPLPPVPEPAPPRDLTVPAPAPGEPPAPSAASANLEAAKPANGPVPVAAPQPGVAKGGQRSLHFRFKGPSWVEVRESRSGRVVMQRLNEAGAEADVNARAPFSVVVGNAPEVEMQMDGQAFNLDPHTRVAVARFTVE
jgi:cytoskeleton protein RodZ